MMDNEQHPTFAVICDGCCIEIQRNGKTADILYPQEAAELAAALTTAVEIYWKQYEDDQADIAAENAALNEAEDAGIRQRETALEMEFDRLGYNNIPF